MQTYTDNMSWKWNVSVKLTYTCTGWVKKSSRPFVIHTVHEQWSVRHHDCVISDIKFIMKTCLLELEPWLVYLLDINLSVNAICITAFSNICDVDNFCVLMSRTGYFLLTYPINGPCKLSNRYQSEFIEHVIRSDRTYYYYCDPTLTILYS